MIVFEDSMKFMEHISLFAEGGGTIGRRGFFKVCGIVLQKVRIKEDAIKLR